VEEKRALSLSLVGCNAEGCSDGEVGDLSSRRMAQVNHVLEHKRTVAAKQHYLGVLADHDGRHVLGGAEERQTLRGEELLVQSRSVTGILTNNVVAISVPCLVSVAFSDDSRGLPSRRERQRPN
jgi:hypothetical protein